MKKNEILNNIYEDLPQANPLQKKSLKKPYSIFPFIQLPQFKYGQIQSYLFKTNRFLKQLPKKQKQPRKQISPKKNSNLYEQNQILQLQETQLNNLFANPLYSYNKRLSKGSNKNFGNIKVFSEQSHDHGFIEDSILFKKQNEKTDNLQFESRFQSGNLAFASNSKINENQYYLILTKDYNTGKCTQWFYFRVNNHRKVKCRFHILNFFKNYSAFQYGMQLCYCSKSNNYTWNRGGQQIKYLKTNLKSDKGNMYALSFDFDFTYNQDIVYFAYSYPYTYSQLDRFLFDIENKNSNILKRKTIGYSLGGNSIDMLTITNPKSNFQNKRIIFITARIHPGETPSSFVMQGIIKKLIQDSQTSYNLRENFIFKLVPMLNPDGVINGNYRCSLSGYDLNRVWNRYDKDKFPQLYSVKKVIQSSLAPFIFIDLHAHSKKKGLFMYGCNLKKNPFLCRQLPFLFWKNIPEFNYFQCNFTLNKLRQGTGRINIFQQFGINFSYTMQCSFCGPLKQKKQFIVSNFYSIGYNLILTIQKYYCKKKNNLFEQQNDSLLQQLYSNKEYIKVGNNQDLQSSSDSELQAQFEIQTDISLSQTKQITKNQKAQPAQKINIIRNNDFKDQKPKIILSARTTAINQKCGSLSKLIKKRVPNKIHQISKVGLNLDDLRKDSEDILELQLNNANFQNYNSVEKKQEQNNDKLFIKTSFNRYSQDEVNNLTNLFLPSVTSISYKKYGKTKSTSKGFVQVGKKFLQSHGILKPEIQSVSKRRIQWKNQGKTFF